MFRQAVEPRGRWEEALGHFASINAGNTDNNMDATKFYTLEKFGLLVNLRSMKDRKMHGSSIRLVPTKDGLQREIQRTRSGSSSIKCHIFVVVEALLNIQYNELEPIAY